MSDTTKSVDELRNDIAKVIAKLKNSKPNTPVSNCHDMPIILVNGEWQCSQCEKGAGGSENWRLQGEYSANDALDCLVQLFAKQLEEAEIRARLDEVQRTKGIESEVGKLANHSLRVQVHLEARIAELTKGGTDE